MLIDQINERTGVVYPGGARHDVLLEPLRRRLATARAFVFGAEAVHMAASVSLGKPSSIVAALPWVRLPAPTTWIEFSNLDMRQAMAAFGSPNLPPPNAEVQISRTGFLLREIAGVLMMDYVHADKIRDGRTVTDLAAAQVMFDLDSSPPSVETAVNGRSHGEASGRVRQHLKLISEDPAEAAAEAALRGRFRWTPHPDLAPAAAGIAKLKGPHLLRQIEENQASDAWRMFCGMILPGLILLNCRNAVETETVEPSAKLNRARVAKGRPALRTHDVIRMHMTAARRRKSEGAGHGAVASAFVIGHFKVRRPKGRSKGGVFWWSPHVRLGVGDPQVKPSLVMGR